MSENFIGPRYRLADNWYPFIPLEEHRNKPIRYLEIGTFYGSNLVSVAETYGAHKDSQLHCIDPWEDYEDYPEYKEQQQTTYATFLTNVENSGAKDRIVVHRGYSNREIPTFEDNFFDIIYNVLLSEQAWCCLRIIIISSMFSSILLHMCFFCLACN